jgi:hypothetical protein
VKASNGSSAASGSASTSLRVRPTAISVPARASRTSSTICGSAVGGGTAGGVSIGAGDDLREVRQIDGKVGERVRRAQKSGVRIDQVGHALQRVEGDAEHGERRFERRRGKA